jgi:capsular polysaccharide biosynthesis protein
MSIPVAGQAPSVDRGRGVGGGVFDDHVPAGNPAAAGPAGRRRPVGVAVGVFMSLLACALIGIQVLPVTYAATSIVSFVPKPSAMTSADVVQLVGQKYVVIATSAPTVRAAGDAVQIRPDDLSSSTTAALDIGTGNIEITVRRPDRQQAADAANAVSDVLVLRSKQDALVAAESTSPAVASRAVLKPPRALLQVAGGLAAALAAVLTWAVLRGRSRGRGRGIW